MRNGSNAKHNMGWTLGDGTRDLDGAVHDLLAQDAARREQEVREHRRSVVNVV